MDAGVVDKPHCPWPTDGVGTTAAVSPGKRRAPVPAGTEATGAGRGRASQEPPDICLTSAGAGDPGQVPTTAPVRTGPGRRLQLEG